MRLWTPGGAPILPSMHSKKEWMISQTLMLALLLGSFLALGVSAAPAGETGMVPVEPGVDLYYRKIGSGPGTLVVILVAESLVDDLAPLAEGRTVIFYNPRGRGKSSRIDASKVSFENDFRDLEAVRRHFKLEKMALLGWSHYGMMTARYAMRHPERVSRLIQLTPAAPRRDPYLEEGMAEQRSRVDGDAWGELQKKRDSGVFKGDPAAECRAFRKVTLPASFGDPAAAERIRLDDCDLPNEQLANQDVWWKAMFDSVDTYDIRSELRGLKIPRLVIAGDKDFIPMSASREWVEGMPEARLLVLRGVGHFPQVEAREALVAALKTFLDGGWPAGAEAGSSKQER
jgi:proline iminopeptidase